MSRWRQLGIGLAALVALTALWSTLFWARLPSRLPTDDDYRRVNELLASKMRPGDIVVLSPAWADRGRPFLTTLPVYAGYDLANDRYPGTKRQWLVALPDVPHYSLAEARAALLARGSSQAPGERIGELYVEPFAIAGAPVAFSFLENVGSAEVAIGGMRPETCRDLPGGVHQCSHGEWNHVAAEWHEMQERPFRCIWAHPIGRDPVTITFTGVPLPPGSHIVGWGGLVGDAGKSPGAPVDLAIQVAGQDVGGARAESHPGRQPFDVTLPPTPDRATVMFAVSAFDAGNRHFCFDAWVQPPG